MEHDLLFDKIERYLKGNMPAAETAAFEQLMAADPELAEQVELQRFELESLDFILEEDLRDKFARWKKKPPGNAPSGSHWRRWWWAPVVLLGVAALWFFWPAPEQPAAPENQTTPPPVSTPDRPIATQDNQNNTPPGNTAPAPADRAPQYLALAESNHRLSERLTGTLRDAGAQTPTPGDALAEGIRAYSNGAYQQAAAAFQKIQAADKQYTLAQEWLGHTYFQQNQFSKAAGVFRNLADQLAGTTAQDDAEWSWLVSLLPQYKQHKQEADQLLQKMRKPENYHRYEPDANKLAKDLDKLR